MRIGCEALTLSTRQGRRAPDPQTVRPDLQRAIALSSCHAGNLGPYSTRCGIVFAYGHNGFTQTLYEKVHYHEIPVCLCRRLHVPGLEQWLLATFNRDEKGRNHHARWKNDDYHRNRRQEDGRPQRQIVDVGE